MNNDDAMMSSNNMNVTPMETEDGIVRLVPQTTAAEVTPTTVTALNNTAVSTVVPIVNPPALTAVSLNNSPVQTTVPHSNLLMPTASTVSNSSVQTIAPLSNPIVSTVVPLVNSSTSPITSINNPPVSTISVLNNPSLMSTTTQKNVAMQHQQQQQLQSHQLQLQQQIQQRKLDIQLHQHDQKHLLQVLQQLQQPRSPPHQQQPQQQQQPLAQQQKQQLAQQQQQLSQPQQPSLSIQSLNSTLNTDHIALLTRTRLRELVKEVDPNEQLDEDVEELLLQISDEFVDEVVRSACVFAKHRKSNIVEVKDVQLYLERYLNMWIPGFGTDELRPYKKAPITEAHKQRIALIKKVSSKKY